MRLPDRKWLETRFHLRQRQEISGTNNEHINNLMKVCRQHHQDRDMIALEQRINVAIVNSITVVWLSIRFEKPNAEHVLTNASFISTKDARFEKKERKTEFTVDATVNFTKAHTMCEE